ncbi:uncharacterized protein LOC125232132 isoform X2 [Leguminivora glycinivorella]|uniref:uncharacterized protein LOC125232132 isoform X2 n=1 Tax=Leguminivora glycinivorella TaxID=1035111 RepID=UPI0020107203|nr:uncharacterized protein LOC125232132 isoform X2 [Leguminivora glycinivorella]
MIIFALALLFAFAATLAPNGTEELEQYDPIGRRKAIYDKVSKALIEKESKPGQQCTEIDWELAHFVDRYLEHAQAHAPPQLPDDFTLNDLSENFDTIDNLLRTELDDNPHDVEEYEFTEFVNKRKQYEPTVVWKEKEKNHKRNMTHELVEALDSTDDMIDVNTSSGRRFWNYQWPDPQKPHNSSVNMLNTMRQAIYWARDRMKVMQQLRQQYRKTALYKMGYLFAKTDFACKVYASLAFKSFKDCSVTRMRPFDGNRLFKFYLDQAYNIERLVSRWFDIDLLRDLLISNDMLARGVLLKDQNLTSARMIVKAFNEMFIE